MSWKNRRPRIQIHSVNMIGFAAIYVYGFVVLGSSMSHMQVKEPSLDVDAVNAMHLDFDTM